MNKVPRWIFRYVGNKTFDFSSKKRGIFAQNWHFCSFWAGSFGALLVDWLVVVGRGLYLARHLFTLFFVPHLLLLSSKLSISALRELQSYIYGVK